jgi:hypothetical protein
VIFSRGEAYLALVEDFLCNLILKRLRRFLLLQNLILPQRQETLEEILANGEPENELLPWETWTIEEYC